MKTFVQVLSEAPKKPTKDTVVFAFGRMNPPTMGHGILIDKVLAEASSNNADHMVFASVSQDSKKNPLSFSQKMGYLKTFFPKVNFSKDPTVKDPYMATLLLCSMGYKNIIMVAGSDQVASFSGIANYKGKPSRDGKMSYSFDTFTVKQAGEVRTEKVTIDSVESMLKNKQPIDPKIMSASLLRGAAVEGKFNVFSAGMPKGTTKAFAKKMYSDIRRGMGLSEQYIAEQTKDKIHVLCLTSAEGGIEGSTVEKIGKSCKKHGMEFDVVKVKFAHVNSMKASGASVTLENIDGDGKSITIKPMNTVAVVRGGVLNSQIGVGTMTVLQNSGVFMVNEKGAMELCANKLQTALALQKHKLPHPRTAFVADEKSIPDAMKAIGGKYPVVVKTLTGAEGIGVSIIESEKSLTSVLQSLWKFGAEIIIQEFIPGFKNDVRSLVLNGKLFASAKRDKAKGDFRTNIARGSKGGSIKLNPDEVELVERAARVSKCYYVGVDHVVVDGKPYIIEMNASPGSGNVYQMYDDEGNPTDEVEGDRLIDHLMEHLSHKSNWKLFSSVAVSDEIYVDGHHLVAKIDTGNSGYNCIHATDIKINEKDHTVSFKLLGKYPMTKKIESRVSIKHGSTEKRTVRPVIMLPVKFQDREFGNVKFSLADRSHMKFSVLVGVRFLVQAGVQVNPKEMSADKPLPAPKEIGESAGSKFKTKTGKTKASPKDRSTGLPKKYLSGLSDTQRKRRDTQFAKRKDRSDSDPKAWEPLPGDPKKTAKKSKYSSAYASKFGDEYRPDIEEAVLSFIDSDRPITDAQHLEVKARQRYQFDLAEAYRLLIDVHKQSMYKRFKEEPTTLDEEFVWFLYEAYGKSDLDEVLEVGTDEINCTYRKASPGQICPSDKARLKEVADEEKNAIYKEWSKLVNMAPKELEDFIDSDEGKEAGLSRKESSKAGSGGEKIKSGRDSARAIVRMLQRKKESWNDNDWEWAKRQINFINRMKGAKGPSREPDGKPTRKLLALKIWGHDPEKSS